MMPGPAWRRDPRAMSSLGEELVAEFTELRERYAQRAGGDPSDPDLFRATELLETTRKFVEGNRRT
jgi:hypothetical protein